MAILDWGDKVLVAHRRLFERDALRFFLGTVTDYEAGIFKVKGRTYLQDPATGGIHKKNDERTKIYSVQSGAILVYHLPAEVCIGSLEFTGHWGSITLRNKSGFKMDLAEQFQDMPGSAEARKWELLAP